MNQKLRKTLVYLFKALYEIGAFTLMYFVTKYLAESVG